MSDYAHRHHPQVQARRDPGAITLNAFTKQRYLDALKNIGIIFAPGVSKVQLWNRVRQEPDAIQWLKDMRG